MVTESAGRTVPERENRVMAEDVDSALKLS
jgi:hypothetical protein